MSADIGLYVERTSTLHSLNPMTKIVLAACLIAVNFIAPGYWLPTILFVVVVLPLALWAGVTRAVMRTLIQIIAPMALFLFILQIFAPSVGGTVLFSFWIFTVKLEAVQLAYLLTSRLFTMVGLFLLVLTTTSPTILMADLARRKVHPALVYIVLNTLQIIPLTQARARTIIDAQRARGLETEGNILVRARALLPMVVPLILGSLQETEERAIALEARAFKARRPKTSLIMIPDTQFERVLRIVFVLATILFLIGAFLLWR